MLDAILSFGITAIIVGIIVLILGAIFIVKCLSMYNKSLKDRKYDEMLEKPLEKFDDQANELAKKYNENK